MHLNSFPWAYMPFKHISTHIHGPMCLYSLPWFCFKTHIYSFPWASVHYSYPWAYLPLLIAMSWIQTHICSYPWAAVHYSYIHDPIHSHEFVFKHTSTLIHELCALLIYMSLCASTQSHEFFEHTSTHIHEFAIEGTSFHIYELCGTIVTWYNIYCIAMHHLAQDQWQAYMLLYLKNHLFCTFTYHY